MSKAKVKAFAPDALAERHKTTGGRKYWLIRRRGAFMYIASGSTEGEAWRNALAKLREIGAVK